MDPITLIVIGSILLGIGAAIAWQVVRGWMEERKLQDNAKLGELIQEKLASGRVKVIGNAYDNYGRLVGTQVWEADKLDDEVAEKFAGRTRVTLTL